jgi:peptidyl-prolyl cis-trans isomerase D
MLILLASFGIWGIGDMFRGNPLKRTVADVGSESVSVQQLNSAFEQGLSRARQMFGPEMTAQQAKQMGLLKQSLDGLIEQSLVDQDLKRLGINADDGAVLDELKQNPRFKDKDGKFDKTILQNLLAQSGMSEGEFLATQRKEIASRQLVSPVSAVPSAPASMLEALYRSRGEKRVFDVVTVKADALPPSPTPDDKVLRDYYQQNPKAFTAPETRGLTIAVLSTDSFAKDITISDDQVKKEYDSKNDQLKTPEKRDLLQVILQDEDKAKEVAAAAKTSHNLVTAAKPTGKTVIPLNGVEEASIFPELAKPVFALKEGETTDPIKTDLGWHVMQLRKITPAGVPKFDEVKESLRESMRRDQAVDSVTKLVNQLDDELAAGHALEDIADGMKLRLIKIADVDATGKLPDGKDPAELPYKADVLKEAFAQQNGETSPVLDDKSGNYYVVRTDHVNPSALKPFDPIRSDVIAAWKKQDQEKRAEDEAEAIAKDLRDGKPTSAVASRPGVQVRVSKPVSLLGDNDPELPKAAMQQLLLLKKGQATVVPGQGQQLVVRLASIQPVADAKDEAALNRIKLEITGNAPKELADQYLKYLRVVFPVKIHQDAVDSVAQQGG